MKIDVTQEDIVNGKKKSCDECPIALAMIRAGYKNVSVGSYFISSGNLTYLVPPEVTKFVLDFDAEKPVSPFSFELGEPIS